MKFLFVWLALASIAFGQLTPLGTSDHNNPELEGLGVAEPADETPDFIASFFGEDGDPSSGRQGDDIDLINWANFLSLLAGPGIDIDTTDPNNPILTVPPGGSTSTVTDNGDGTFTHDNGDASDPNNPSTWQTGWTTATPNANGSITLTYPDGADFTIPAPSGGSGTGALSVVTNPDGTTTVAFDPDGAGSLPPVAPAFTHTPSTPASDQIITVLGGDPQTETLKEVLERCFATPHFFMDGDPAEGDISAQIASAPWLAVTDGAGTPTAIIGSAPSGAGGILGVPSYPDLAAWGAAQSPAATVDAAGQITWADGSIPNVPTCLPETSTGFNNVEINLGGSNAATSDAAAGTFTMSWVEGYEFVWRPVPTTNWSVLGSILTIGSGTTVTPNIFNGLTVANSIGGRHDEYRIQTWFSDYDNANGSVTINPQDRDATPSSNMIETPVGSGTYISDGTNDQGIRMTHTTANYGTGEAILPRFAISNDAQTSRDPAGVRVFIRVKPAVLIDKICGTIVGAVDSRGVVLTSFNDIIED